MKKHILLTATLTAGASMLFAQNGNVGIGTTTPTAKLHVKSSAGNNNFFRVSDNNDSTRLLLSNGFLNGTLLRVSPQQNSGGITLNASAAGGSNNSLLSSKSLSINVDGWLNFFSGSQDFLFTNGITGGTTVMRLLNGNLCVGSTTDNKSIATTRLEVKNNSVGDHALALGGMAPSIRFYGGDTIPGVGPLTFDVPYAKIGLVTQAGQFANSAIPGDMVIQTVDTSKSIIFSNLFGGGNGFEQMRLNGNGNLGIGTAAPTAKLHVAGNVRIVDGTQGLNKILSSDANGASSWKTAAELGIGGGSGWALAGNNLVGSEILGSTNTQPLRIVTDAIERMRVTETGNVGIGTITPTAKLHVKGGTDNNYFRVSDNNDGTRLLLTNGFPGRTDLQVRPQDSSSSISLVATGTSGITNYLISDKHLRIDVDSAIDFSARLNDFTFTNGLGNKAMRLLNGNLFVGSTSDNQSVATTRVQIQNDAVGDNALAIGGAAPSIRFYGGNTLPPAVPSTFNVPYAKIGLATTPQQFTASTVPGDLVIQTIDTNNAIIFSNNFPGGGIEQMRLNGNGNLGIGTATPAYKLEVAGDINAIGSVRSNGVILTSDARLKRNITPLTEGVSIIKELNPVKYEKKNSIESNDYTKHEIGFIAQEIQTVLPELVSEGKDIHKTLAVDYNALIPILTKAIQEQQAQIEELKAQNKQLTKLASRTCIAEKAYADLAEEVKEMQQMLGISKIVSGSKVAGK